MTTSPYGETDPFATAASQPPDAATPIGDELAGTADLDTSTTGADGTVGTAKDKAQDALGSASEHGSHVADTAKDEATKVASEAKDKATDLLADVKTQVDEQSRTQLQNLASKLGELAGQIDDLLSGSDAGGTVTDVAQQLSDRTHQLSSHLESREPLDLLEDVRGFARRRPAAFLAGAAVAGVLAGRLTRGAKASQDSDSSTADTSGSSDAPDVSSAIVSDPPFATAPLPSDDPFVGVDDVVVPAGQNTGGRQ